MTDPIHVPRAPGRELRAYERLRELIVHGDLPPGARVTEIDLAELVGVSRTPIRSAMHRLRQEGFLVSSGHGRNARLAVAPLTVDDARELLTVLGTLEGQAAAWAAELPGPKRASLAAELRSINADLGARLLVPKPEVEEIFQIHSRFHQATLQRVRAPRLQMLHAAIRPQAERYRRVYLASIPSGLFAPELAEHELIVDALERGDGAAAQQAVQANWRGAGERLARRIAAAGEQGRR